MVFGGEETLKFVYGDGRSVITQYMCAHVCQWPNKDFFFFEGEGFGPRAAKIHACVRNIVWTKISLTTGGWKRLKKIKTHFHCSVQRLSVDKRSFLRRTLLRWSCARIKEEILGHTIHARICIRCRACACTCIYLCARVHVCERVRGPFPGCFGFYFRARLCTHIYSSSV
jgi:hypothetical protein